MQHYCVRIRGLTSPLGPERGTIYEEISSGYCTLAWLRILLGSRRKGPGLMSNSSDAPAHHHHPVYMLIGLGIGAALGLTLNVLFVEKAGAPPAWLSQLIYIAEPIGKVFLRLMSMVVVPLVLSALAARRLSKLAIRDDLNGSARARCSIRRFFHLRGVARRRFGQPGSTRKDAARGTTTTIAIGALFSGDDVANGQGRSGEAAARDVLVDLLPENPLQEMAGAIDGSSKGNGMLAVMVFALDLRIGDDDPPRRNVADSCRFWKGCKSSPWP
ncbi:MAG: cation:dicarboxylase symporter family transporter [Planctomycetaceae bacterium]